MRGAFLFLRRGIIRLWSVLRISRVETASANFQFDQLGEVREHEGRNSLTRKVANHDLNDLFSAKRERQVRHIRERMDLDNRSTRRFFEFFLTTKSIAKRFLKLENPKSLIYTSHFERIKHLWE